MPSLRLYYIRCVRPTGFVEEHRSFVSVEPLSFAKPASGSRFQDRPSTAVHRDKRVLDRPGDHLVSSLHANHPRPQRSPYGQR